MLEELLIGQRLNAGARGLILSGLQEDSERTSTERLLSRRLSRLLTFDSRLPESGKFLAFVGPSGSGKSCAVAKLAIRIRETFALNVGLVGIESAWSGRKFHLQTFAQLAGMPFEACQANENAEEAIARLSGCDLILADVATGMEQSIQHLEGERLLVMPAYLSQDEIARCAADYPDAQNGRVFVTHLDSCGYTGPLVQGLLEIARTIAFFSTGQRIPQDVEPATARRLAKMLTRKLH